MATVASDALSQALIEAFLKTLDGIDAPRERQIENVARSLAVHMTCMAIFLPKGPLCYHMLKMAEAALEMIESEDFKKEETTQWQKRQT